MNKILIVGPAWVGDMVMAQSLFKVIKQRNPSADITVLAPEWSTPILTRMPEVDASVCMPIEHGKLGLSTRRKIGRDLNAAHFDHAIVLPGSFKSALVPWFANIPTRSGYVGEQRWGLLNDIRRLDRAAMPMNVQRFVALGFPKSTTVMQPADIPNPTLQVEPSAVREAAARFNLPTEQPVVALCPGAEYGPAKRWSPAYFAEVATQQLQHGTQVWLFGSENDREIAAHINQLCEQRCADLSGRTSLGEAIDLMSLAQHVVTNDSGLMHIAAAIGCHVIAIYGSSSDVFTPPLTEHCTRLSLDLDCSPCFQRVCPLGHLNCLNQLQPSRVLSSLK